MAAPKRSRGRGGGRPHDSLPHGVAPGSGVAPKAKSKARGKAQKAVVRKPLPNFSLPKHLREGGAAAAAGPPAPSKKPSQKKKTNQPSPAVLDAYALNQAAKGKTAPSGRQRGGGNTAASTAEESPSPCGTSGRTGGVVKAVGGFSEGRSGEALGARASGPVSSTKGAVHGEEARIGGAKAGVDGTGDLKRKAPTNSRTARRLAAKAAAAEGASSKQAAEAAAEKSRRIPKGHGRKKVWDWDNYTAALLQPRTNAYGGLGLARQSEWLQLGDPTFMDRFSVLWQEHVDGFTGTLNSHKKMRKEKDSGMLWRQRLQAKQAGGATWAPGGKKAGATWAQLAKLNRTELMGAQVVHAMPTGKLSGRKGKGHSERAG